MAGPFDCFTHSFARATESGGILAIPSLIAMPGRQIRERRKTHEFDPAASDGLCRGLLEIVHDAPGHRAASTFANGRLLRLAAGDQRRHERVQALHGVGKPFHAPAERDDRLVRR